MWGRKKSAGSAESTSAVPELVEVTGPRADGPFDITERPIENPDEYLDLGTVVLKVRPGIDVQLPTENDVVTAVLVAAEGSAIELRPFAGNKSGGTWAGVLDDLRGEVEKRKGEFTEVDGPFGAEIVAKFPATGPDGQPAIQPVRFIGVEGPRWVLRATIMGAAALESADAGVLLQILRDVRIRRGDEPRILRESLPLVLPPDAQRTSEA